MRYSAPGEALRTIGLQGHSVAAAVQGVGRVICGEGEGKGLAVGLTQGRSRGGAAGHVCKREREGSHATRLVKVWGAVISKIWSAALAVQETKLPYKTRRYH